MIKYIVGHDNIKNHYTIVALENSCSHCNENISKKKRYLKIHFQKEDLAKQVCRTLNEEYEKNIAHKVIMNFTHH